MTERDLEVCRKRFGEVLKHFRVKSRIRPKDLADFELQPFSISRYENGIRFPQLEVLFRMADAYKCTATDFFKMFDAYSEEDSSQDVIDLVSLFNELNDNNKNLLKDLILRLIDSQKN